MKISLIAAIASENRALGKDNDLIYKIPEDLKRFKDLTSGHTIIMGRKTFESIGRPLPNRTNIIITRDASKIKLLGCQSNAIPRVVEFVGSLEEALKLAKEKEEDEVFIIGGGEIFEEAISKADKLYLTIVEGSPEADTFFPDYSEFKKVVYQSEQQQSDGFKYRFLELGRN